MATDDEALDMFMELASKEGIVPALESAHALVEAKKAAAALDRRKVIVVNLSGRGDKDVEEVARIRGEDMRKGGAA